jgi:hypothetical protein
MNLFHHVGQIEEVPDLMRALESRQLGRHGEGQACPADQAFQWIADEIVDILSEKF